MPPKRRQETAAEAYDHKDREALLRPDVGLQAQFKKKKPPAKYRYDPSLDPELSWDINADRERAEALIERIRTAATLEEAKAAAEQLKRMSQPFLNWAGKAERAEFTVPTLPLFVHERLSTKAILESVRTKKRQLALFADPEVAIADRALRAYEHKTGWVNRLILGDSLIVMNSLLQYEGLGGQVQMIYMDPPYGVKFGSNFQPFIRRRDVKHNDDEDMTREPEMVQAYRDTWSLGLHSYLTYLRDRFSLMHALLHQSGSIFVQISDENAHLVRLLLDEIFGANNFMAQILFRKTGGLTSNQLASVGDYLLWYAKDREHIKYRQLFIKKRPGEPGATQYRFTMRDGRLIELPESDLRNYAPTELLAHDNLTSQGNPVYEYEYGGETFKSNFKPPKESMDRLAQAGRLVVVGKTLRYMRFLSDFPYFEVNQLWDDVGISGFAESKIYAVQTSPIVIQRCILMTTDPGDLVLDPTCLRKGMRVWRVEPGGSPPVVPPHAGGQDGRGTSFFEDRNMEIRPETFSLPACGEGRGGAGSPCGEGWGGAGSAGAAPLESPRTRGDEAEGWGSAGLPPCVRGGARGLKLSLVPIEEIRPGEWVLAHDGRLHRVARRICKHYKGIMVGLQHAQTRQVLWVTADHKVLARRRPRSLGGQADWSGIPRNLRGRSRELRRRMTPPEHKLWQALRNERLGVGFRRQHPIGPYILDFYSRRAMLAVEVDGRTHEAPEKAAYDRVRDAYLAALGLRVLRFPACRVEEEPEAVVEEIRLVCEEELAPEGAEWVEAGSLAVGDIVFWGPDRIGVPVTAVHREVSDEDVYDLEVEEAHSFLTEVCAVHNCGSGTTAYVAEQWGRRWITIDTSRVPIALAKQRLLTATYDYYELRDEKAGVAGGFKYERRQNSKGEEVGGIVPHITLKSIANGEPPEEEVLVDRPNIVPGIVRVTGPFVLEATIPTPVDIDADGVEDSGVPAGDHYQRMLEVLRRSPVLRLPGNRTVTFKNVRPPARSLNLHAEAVIEGNGEKPVAFLFGPESGAVSEKMVFEAAREAYAKSYAHLYVIGFACQDAATRLIRDCESVVGIPATFVAATMDIAMHDLLKTSRASQVFSVTGAPEIRLLKLKQKGANGEDLYQVKLLGLDVFDPVTMETDHLQGNDVPAWFLDTDYNELSFLVCQAFFPRTSAWDNLKRELRGIYLDSVWEHLAGDTSEPFAAGENGRIAVKVIDERGNELMVVKPLAEAEVEA